MSTTTNEGTVLGGRYWKIIRTDRTLPTMSGPRMKHGMEIHAIKRGDDLHVSWDLFNAMHEIFSGDEEPDRSDPEGINKEVCELGEMLTATELPTDHKRFVSIVSRLLVLYGKSDPEGVCGDDGQDSGSTTPPPLADRRLRNNGKPVMGPGSDTPNVRLTRTERQD